MARLALNTTKDFLEKLPLPQHGGRYTVIPHSFVIDKTLEELNNRGFEVARELYRCTNDGQVAQGIYHLNYGADPEMGMMFAWSNSYDKSMRFKCAIGGYVFVCMNGMVSGNMGSWGRKHTGTADKETEETIHLQMVGAEIYYNQLVSDKEAMKQITVDQRVRAALLGQMVFHKGCLGVEQASLVSKEIENPSFDYKTDKDSLWVFYNHITHSLKSSSPRFWLEKQRAVHGFLTSEFSINNTILEEKTESLVAGKQLDLEEVIQEVENENSGSTHENSVGF